MKSSLLVKPLSFVRPGPDEGSDGWSLSLNRVLFMVRVPLLDPQLTLHPPRDTCASEDSHVPYPSS